MTDTPQDAPRPQDTMSVENLTYDPNRDLRKGVLYHITTPQSAPSALEQLARAVLEDRVYLQRIDTHPIGADDQVKWRIRVEPQPSPPPSMPTQQDWTMRRCANCQHARYYHYYRSDSSGCFYTPGEVGKCDCDGFQMPLPATS